jgi:hypothetical protein
MKLTPQSRLAFSGREPGVDITIVKRPSSPVSTCSSKRQSITRWLANSFSHSDQ